MTLAEATTVYDLFAPEALHNPYPLYQRMRAEDPVHLAGRYGFWVLTRYRDVAAALRDARLSSDRRPIYAQQLRGLDLGLIHNFLRLTDRMILVKDPPEHTPMRKIANAGFTARALASWPPIVHEVTNRLLDAVERQGRMDIVSDLAVGLPAQIISDIFGVPRPDRPQFLQWGTDVATFFGVATSDNIEAVARTADTAAAAFQAYLEQLIAERRRRPGSDMVSLLIAAYEQSGADIGELPALCALILNAGWLTTTDLIANGVNALLRHPDQWHKLKENPTLIGSAVEEIARFDTATQFPRRTAREDLMIGDRLIPAGSVVALGLGAANHDPEVFAVPEAFDITRTPNPHLTFGHGVHFCLGAVLARMELTACFEALARRMPEMRFDPDRETIPRRTSLSFKGFERLPVRF